MAGVALNMRRVSYADMERWPDDGRRYELYDGEVFELPSPFPVHQIIAARLHIALEMCVRERGGIVLFAPLDIVLTDYDVVQPDLLLFTAERAGVVHPSKVTRAAPDLAIEILSPATAANDRGRKRALLARHGVREYWLVDPDARTIEIFSLRLERLVSQGTQSGDALVSSPLLPDLALRASALFD
jgi:Uma2 family endonuclease